MKKKILFGLTGLAFGALLILNVNIVSKGTSSDLILLKTFMIASAEDGEGGGWISYVQTKTTNTGTATSTAIINGVSYTRTCNYIQTICSGTGTTECTPSLNTTNCSDWKQSWFRYK
jgi:hypothetical protein